MTPCWPGRPDVVLSDPSHGPDTCRRLVRDLGVKPLSLRRDTERGSGPGTRLPETARVIAPDGSDTSAALVEHQHDVLVLAVPDRLGAPEAVLLQQARGAGVPEEGVGVQRAGLLLLQEEPERPCADPLARAAGRTSSR